MKSLLNIADVSRPDREPVTHLENSDLMSLPAPLDDSAKDRAWGALAPQIRDKYECGLDDTCAVSVPQPKTKAEEQRLVAQFLSGLEKLFTRENNWTFLQPLLLTMEHCTHCQTCAESWRRPCRRIAAWSRGGRGTLWLEHRA